MANLGVNYRDVRRLEEAIPLLKQAYDAGRKHASLRWVGAELLIAYVRAGRSVEGVALVKANVSAARETLPEASPGLAAVLAQNGLALLELKAWADAEPILRECLAIREKTEADDWRTFNAQSLLGDALLGRHKYADAEPLLLQGYRGMKERQSKIPTDARVYLSHALDRLVRLYDQWDRPAEASRWRKQLEAAKAARCLRQRPTTRSRLI